MRGMSNQQLYLAVGLPILFNGLLLTIVFSYMNVRFSAIEKRFDHIDRRFDDMSIWNSTRPVPFPIRAASGRLHSATGNRPGSHPSTSVCCRRTARRPANRAGYLRRG